MPLRTSDRQLPPFATEAELRAWLESEGLAHLARARLDVLLPRLDAALGSQLPAIGTRRPLVELANHEGLARFRREVAASSLLARELPRQVWAFLDEARGAAQAARAAVTARLVEPDDARARPLHGRLCELRERVPAWVAPRPLAELRPEALVIDPQLPGFRLHEPLSFEGPPVDVRLALAPSGARSSCSCGAGACRHALAAIDAALLWLHQPLTPARAAELAELERPSWQRALTAFELALDEQAAEEADVELSFRLSVLEHWGVLVAPYLHRRTRRGGRSAGTRVSRRRLLVAERARLSPLEARIVALLPESNEPASRALLDELAEHPRLLSDLEPELPVRIERARIGLVAEDRGGAVVVSAGIEGAPLPAVLVERLRKARPDELVYLWEEGARRLTLLDAAPELKPLLAALERHGHLFPPESHGALVEKLSLLSRRMPVAMPRSVMGEAVPLDERVVVRLEVQPRGAVRLELRTRPLPESAALVPGEGARDVHVRRGERAVHVVRDLAREQATARALLEALPLEGAEPARPGGPFCLELPSIEACLELVRACQALAPRPELEWVGQAIRVFASPGPAALKVVLDRRRNWFGVLGGLSVEGERVELARLLDSARRKQRFVEVEPRSYVEIDELLRERLERLADHAWTSRHGLELGPSAIEAVGALASAGATVEADAHWNGLVERMLAANELEPRVPSTLKATLRDYQREGFRWLSRLAGWGAGGILADDMGLGKTVQALAVLLDRSRLGPQLVLAPTSVAFNWIDEAKRFAPSLRMVLYAEAEDRGRTLARLRGKDVLVLSYGLLARDAERLAQLRFASIVFDEAQVLKNATTRRARAARALQGDFKLALSGTPLENHLGELWSLYGAVFPSLLGSWEAFRTRFAGPIEKQIDPTAAPALARVLQPFLLRRTKAQVAAELPPRTDVRVPVVLSPAEWQLYEDTRLAALSDLETRRAKMREQERRIEILAALTRLRLVASHPRLYDPASSLESSKLARLMELVRELGAEGQRALVFSQFTSHLALVREALDREGIAYQYLDGATPRAAREHTVRAFQEGDAPLFLISLKAGGFGLNLTAATSVIHLDPWWNPAVEDQASDRAHRIGQDQPVTVYRLVARGTIEEQMLALHEHKRSLASGVLDGKDQAGRLSTRDLLRLLTRPPTLKLVP